MKIKNTSNHITTIGGVDFRPGEVKRVPDDAGRKAIRGNYHTVPGEGRSGETLATKLAKIEEIDESTAEALATEKKHPDELTVGVGDEVIRQVEGVIADHEPGETEKAESTLRDDLTSIDGVGDATAEALIGGEDPDSVRISDEAKAQVVAVLEEHGQPT